MKLMRSLKLPAALLVIFLSVQAAYPQYTLVKDTVVFTHFPDSFRIAPSGKAPEYGISVNQFGIPTGEFYGTGYKLTNFKLFGHLVDSMFINHHIHKVHFLLANGKKADLSFRTGNAVFPGGDLWTYDEGYLQDSLEIRMQISGSEGSRSYTWQYIASGGIYGSGGASEYEIRVTEGTSSIRTHYGVTIAPNFVRGPEVTFSHYQSFLRTADRKADSRISYRGLTDIFTKSDLDTSTRVTNMRYNFSLTGHCSNGVMDADETDVDCGGKGCIPCSCADGIQNNTETDVDCGGNHCSSCPGGGFPSCERNDSLPVDTVVWTGGNLFFSIKSGFDVIVDGLTPLSTFEFKFMTPFAFPNFPSVWRASDGEELEAGNFFGTNLYGQNTNEALMANTDSTQQLLFRFLDWLDCDTSLSDSLIVRVSLVSDSSAHMSYTHKPSICMVTYDSLFNMDVVAYEDVMENVTDTIMYAIAGLKVNNFLAGAFRDIDTGETYFVRRDTNILGAHAQYEWDSPRTYNMMMLNSAGVRSDVSAPHSIIAVDAQLAPDSSAVHVAWTPYKGFKDSEYSVYRQLSGDSDAVFLGNVPFSQTWFVDTAFPLMES